METETTTPQFNWPNEDLKNLVKAAPTSPYTRALLRVKYNKPLPPEALTFEAIEAFLAALPPLSPVVKPAGNGSGMPSPIRSVFQRQRDEINRGEFVEVEGRRDGYTNCTESWTRSGTVRVPLSVFEEGEDAVEEYVRDKVDDMDPDYGDTEYGDSEHLDFHIDSDLQEAMEEAEEKIAERDGTNEEDEE